MRCARSAGYAANRGEEPGACEDPYGNGVRCYNIARAAVQISRMPNQKKAIVYREPLFVYVLYGIAGEGGRRESQRAVGYETSVKNGANSKITW